MVVVSGEWWWVSGWGGENVLWGFGWDLVLCGIFVRAYDPRRWYSWNKHRARVRAVRARTVCMRVSCNLGSVVWRLTVRMFGGGCLRVNPR